MDNLGDNRKPAGAAGEFSDRTGLNWSREEMKITQPRKLLLSQLFMLSLCLYH